MLQIIENEETVDKSLPVTKSKITSNWKSNRVLRDWGGGEGGGLVTNKNVDLNFENIGIEVVDFFVAIDKYYYRVSCCEKKIAKKEVGTKVREKFAKNRPFFGENEQYCIRENLLVKKSCAILQLLSHMFWSAFTRRNTLHDHWQSFGWSAIDIT